jgi:hypothetical protein
MRRALPKPFGKGRRKWRDGGTGGWGWRCNERSREIVQDEAGDLVAPSEPEIGTLPLPAAFGTKSANG